MINEAIKELSRCKYNEGYKDGCYKVVEVLNNMRVPNTLPTRHSDLVSWLRVEIARLRDEVELILLERKDK